MSKIVMGTVVSDAIAKVGYSGTSRHSPGDLRIEFLDGQTVTYKQVPWNIFSGLVRSRSKGLYYNNFIRGKFDISE
jgi:hypothetical protein